MDSIWGCIALICGVYCLAGYWKMKKNGEIFQSILLPKEIDLKKCKDLVSYKKEAEPKVLILGIAVTLWGVCDLLCTNLGVHTVAVFWVSFTLVLLVLVWFGVATSKLRKKYFC